MTDILGRLRTAAAYYDASLPSSVLKPHISLVDPNTGPEAGGTRVTVWGFGFTGATGVSFGGVPATNITFASYEDIVCDTPPGTGTVDVTVLSPNGNVTKTGAFTYEAGQTETETAPTGGGQMTTNLFDT
jgi:hypothetical protein